MTVKSTLVLCAGAAIGFFIGMDMDEKIKERISHAIKRKIFYALTGEEMPIKKTQYQPPNYSPYSYNKYYEKEQKDND